MVQNPLSDVDDDPSRIMDPVSWQVAEATLAGPLARAAMALGRLDGALTALDASRLRPGAIARLAMRETEAILWTAGTPLSAEILGRDVMDARADSDPDALRAGRWALRRLQGRGRLDDLRDFLGLHRLDASGTTALLPLRATGDAFDAAAAEFDMAMAAAAGLHPLTRAAFGELALRLSDLTPEGDMVEPACWAARTMACDCVAAVFAPIGRSRRKVRVAGGAPAQRLSAWYDAIAEGADAARTELARLTAWQDHARRRVARIKGDNPLRIVAVLAASPQMTTAMVEAEAGISRDTAERLLVRLAGMGLVRETTGATRFRVWTAAL
jgi:hypothetical protein